MRVITVTNRKGGVGKSTFAAHVAAGLAIRGYRVGMVDTDSQGHLSMMFGIEPTNSLYDVMIDKESLEDHVLVLSADKYTTPDNPPQGALYLLSAYDRTYKIPHELEETDAFVGCNLMADFGQLADLDYIIVDSQPSMTKLDGAIYMATDGFLFVTELETLAMRGLKDAVQQVEKFSAQRDRWLGLPTEIIGIVPNKMRARTVVHQENISELATTYGRFKDGGWVLPPCRLLTVWSQSSDMREPIFKYRPTGEAASDAWTVVDAVEARLAVWAVNDGR